MGGNDDEEAKRVYVACVACTREAGEAAAEGAATAAGGVGNTQSAALHPSSLAVSFTSSSRGERRILQSFHSLATG